MQDNCPTPFSVDPTIPTDVAFSFENCFATLPPRAYLASKNYTISLLYRPNNLKVSAQKSSHAILYMYQTLSGANYRLALSAGPDGFVGFSTVQGQAVMRSSTMALTAGTWTYIAVTLSGANAILYINGTEAVRKTLSANDPSVVRNFNQIGRTDLTYETNSSIKELKIYNKALTQGEIKQYANSYYCTRGLIC